MVTRIKKAVGTQFDRLLLVLQPPTKELRFVLQELLQDSQQVVDLGCGEGNHLRGVLRSDSSSWTGIDSHQPSLDTALDAGVYDEAICANIIEWLQNSPPSSVDTVLASCVIEHLEKPIGLLLAQEMKRVCARQAIVITPNGYVPQPGSDDNPANAHQSGWSVRELDDLGFTVSIGLDGLRGLRTSFGLPTIKPQMLGDLISKSTSRFVFRRPRFAYQIVGVYLKD